MHSSTSTKPVPRRTVFILGAALLTFALGAPIASAQYRGEEIVGKVESVSGTNVVVRRDGGQEVRINIGPQTEVFFQDSGDKKLFPNPSYRDLKAGMGVRFTFNDGNPPRIVVNYVPASGASDTASASATSSSQVKARVQSVTRSGQEIRADVAGSSRTYAVEDAAETRDVRTGDLVVLTLADRNGAQVVTRIDPSDVVGTVVRVDSGRRTVVIEVDGREESYTVDKSDVLDNVRSGQRVRFEVEERSNGRRVVTSLRRE
jgi:Cu/Ag efflux protein CusF